MVIMEIGQKISCYFAEILKDKQNYVEDTNMINKGIGIWNLP